MNSKKDLSKRKILTLNLSKNAVGRLKAGARKVSIKEGCAYSVTEGLGINYISPYALALGATNLHIGFLTSLPNLIGNFSQLYALKLMTKISRRKIAITAAILQALMWLPIIGIGALFFITNIKTPIVPLMLVLVYTILIIFGSFIAPIWSSWMKDIVPSHHSGKYFGMRHRICGAVALVSMLMGSFILDYFKKTNLFLGFAIIFFIAFLFRLLSAFFFTKKYEPPLVLEEGYYFSFWNFTRRMHTNNFGKFVIYVSLMMLVTAIASPFFAVYMLKNLQFGYLTYIVVTMSSVLSSLLFMPLWGKFSDKYGNLTSIRICGFLVPFVPVAWIFSPFILINFPGFLVPYLIIAEVFSGFSWAGFNLSAGNFIYDAVTRQRMAICVSYFNILNGIGIFLGATLGGFIASINFPIIGLSSLLFIFLLSSALRLIISISMVSRINEVRHVRHFGIKEAEKHLSALTPEHILQHLRLRL